MKTSQLQIRVSPSEKRYMQKQAQSEGISVSTWVLRAVSMTRGHKFSQLLSELESCSVTDEQPIFAAISDYLHSLAKPSFADSLPQPMATLESTKLALIASMIEYAAELKNVKAPDWVGEVPALVEPFFSTQLKSLRLYLLLNSPIQFKRRNIFVDSSVGGRV